MNLVSGLNGDPVNQDTYLPLGGTTNKIKVQSMDTHEWTLLNSEVILINWGYTCFLNQ
jgi:hypothetical protein